MTRNIMKIMRQKKSKQWHWTLLLSLPLLVATFGLQSSAEETVDTLKQKAIDEREHIAPPYSPPILLTSFGQGEGASIAYALLSIRGRMPVEFLPQAATEELSQYKTVLVDVGVSPAALKKIGKNLGTENIRVDSILKQAKEKKIPVVLLYLGGERYQEKQTQPFLEKTLDNADYMVVMKEGDSEQYFTAKAEATGTTLMTFNKITDLPGKVRELFRME